MKKRRQLRKWGLACLVIALLVCSLPGTYAAAADSDAIVFDTVESAQVGDTIALDINVADADSDITDGRLVILYDGNALEYVGAEKGEAWTEDTTLEYEVNPDTSGRVVLAFAANVNAGEGTIFTLNFRALQGGSTTIRLRGSYLTGVSPFPDASASIIVEGGAPVEPSDPPVIPPPIDPNQPSGDTDIPDDDTPTGDLPHAGGECPSAVFSDVNTNLWYHEGVDYVVANGLMLGTGSTTFSPDAGTTRSMLVTILYRMAGSPAVSASAPFTDIVAGTFYYNAVLWASSNDITNGVSETSFAPDVQIDREQLATFLYRYAQFTGRDTTARADLTAFGDADQLSDFASEAMSWAVAEGIVQGGSNSVLLPQETATRAQIATMIYRFETAEKE